MRGEPKEKKGPGARRRLKAQRMDQTTWRSEVASPGAISGEGGQRLEGKGLRGE